MAAGQKGLCLLPTSVAWALESWDESKDTQTFSITSHRELSHGSHTSNFFSPSYLLLLNFKNLGVNSWSLFFSPRKFGFQA